MTKNERIELLMREIADLRDRVRALEARPLPLVTMPQPYIPAAPPQPPYQPAIWKPQTTCGATIGITDLTLQLWN